MKTYFMPESMNIELTTNCPLNCPQCYCSLTGGKNIPLDKAVFWLIEGSKMGVESVCLSGGETLCYPFIHEVIRAAAGLCGKVYVALSGYGLTGSVFEKLIRSGTSGIFISLNGSTEQVNSLTRGGYELALDALKLLKEKNYTETWLNWVMHKNNTDDFDNMLALADEHNVKHLVIMAVKPDSRHELKTMPSAPQMIELVKKIRKHKARTQVLIEACFSPMLALAMDDKWYGNSNAGINKGCGAGLTTFNVNVEGKLSPCRHLDYFEDSPNLFEYWNNSEILAKLRNASQNKKQPCAGCRLSPYCRHCMAINSKLNGEIFIGNDACGLSQF